VFSQGSVAKRLGMVGSLISIYCKFIAEYVGNEALIADCIYFEFAGECGDGE